SGLPSSRHRQAFAAQGTMRHASHTNVKRCRRGCRRDDRAPLLLIRDYYRLLDPQSHPVTLRDWVGGPGLDCERCLPDRWGKIHHSNPAKETCYPRTIVIGRAVGTARAARSPGSLVSTMGLAQVLAKAATTASVAVIVAGRPVAVRSRAASRACGSVTSRIWQACSSRLAWKSRR